MDSRLDSIFRSTFQPATETDTWQGIRREESQGHNKKKNQDGRKEGPEEPVDYTTLSVPALQGFLKTLLNDSSEDPDRGTAASAPPSSQNPGSSAYAAMAYQNTANTGQPAATPTAAPHTPRDSDLRLSVEELRTVHLLLKDIDRLIERSIPVIILKPAPTFLSSLANGVREALNAHMD